MIRFLSIICAFWIFSNICAKFKVKKKKKKRIISDCCDTISSLIYREIIQKLNKISLVMRKPVFGVFDQLRLKPACSVAETMRMRRLICTFVVRIYGVNRFSHGVAQIVVFSRKKRENDVYNFKE